jgi:hypothetical protein
MKSITRAVTAFVAVAGLAGCGVGEGVSTISVNSGNVSSSASLTVTAMAREDESGESGNGTLAKPRRGKWTAQQRRRIVADSRLARRDRICVQKNV